MSIISYISTDVIKLVNIFCRFYKELKSTAQKHHIKILKTSKNSPNYPENFSDPKTYQNLSRNSGRTSCSNVDSGVASQDEDEVDGDSMGLKRMPEINDSIELQPSDHIKPDLKASYDGFR